MKMNKKLKVNRNLDYIYKNEHTSMSKQAALSKYIGCLFLLLRDTCSW